MARAHFSSRKDFNKLTESPPAPSPVEVDVETEEKEATDPASQLANLAALLQSAHSNQGGINDIVGAMLSSNQGMLDGLYMGLILPNILMIYFVYRYKPVSRRTAGPVSATFV